MAELLPAHPSQFSERCYWDRFFSERRQQAFEWYGAYADLAPHIHDLASISGDNATLNQVLA